MSTAYSGSTAMNARTAIASPAEMSSCATSAAHDRRKAAPTIAMPNRSASAAGGGGDRVGVRARRDFLLPEEPVPLQVGRDGLQHRLVQVHDRGPVTGHP